MLLRQINLGRGIEKIRCGVLQFSIKRSVNASLQSCHLTKNLKEISQLIRPNPNSVAVGCSCLFVCFLLNLGPTPWAPRKSVWSSTLCKMIEAWPGTKQANMKSVTQSLVPFCEDLRTADFPGYLVEPEVSLWGDVGIMGIWRGFL